MRLTTLTVTTGAVLALAAAVMSTVLAEVADILRSVAAALAVLP